MIRLGSLAGYSFEGPYTLAGWNPIDQPGVYAIMYKQEEGGKDHYAVVYVGHTDNFQEEGFPLKHAASPCWVERAGTQWKLFIAYFVPPGEAKRSIPAGSPSASRSSSQRSGAAGTLQLPEPGRTGPPGLSGVD